MEILICSHTLEIIWVYTKVQSLGPKCFFLKVLYCWFYGLQVSYGLYEKLNVHHCRKLVTEAVNNIEGV